MKNPNTTQVEKPKNLSEILDRVKNDALNAKEIRSSNLSRKANTFVGLIVNIDNDNFIKTLLFTQNGNNFGTKDQDVCKNINNIFKTIKSIDESIDEKKNSNPYSEIIEKFTTIKSEINNKDNAIANPEDKCNYISKIQYYYSILKMEFEINKIKQIAAIFKSQNSDNVLAVNVDNNNNDFENIQKKQEELIEALKERYNINSIHNFYQTEKDCGKSIEAIFTVNTDTSNHDKRQHTQLAIMYLLEVQIKQIERFAKLIDVQVSAHGRASDVTTDNSKDLLDADLIGNAGRSVEAMVKVLTNLATKEELYYTAIKENKALLSECIQNGSILLKKINNEEYFCFNKNDLPEDLLNQLCYEKEKPQDFIIEREGDENFYIQLSGLTLEEGQLTDLKNQVFEKNNQMLTEKEENSKILSVKRTEIQKTKEETKENSVLQIKATKTELTQLLNLTEDEIVNKFLSHVEQDELDKESTEYEVYINHEDVKSLLNAGQNDLESLINTSEQKRQELGEILKTTIEKAKKIEYKRDKNTNQLSVLINLEDADQKHLEELKKAGVITDAQEASQKLFNLNEIIAEKVMGEQFYEQIMANENLQKNFTKDKTISIEEDLKLMLQCCNKKEDNLQKNATECSLIIQEKNKVHFLNYLQKITCFTSKFYKDMIIVEEEKAETKVKINISLINEFLNTSSWIATGKFEDIFKNLKKITEERKAEFKIHFRGARGKLCIKSNKNDNSQKPSPESNENGNSNDTKTIENLKVEETPKEESKVFKRRRKNSISKKTMHEKKEEKKPNIFDPDTWEDVKESELKKEVITRDNIAFQNLEAEPSTKERDKLIKTNKLQIRPSSGNKKKIEIPYRPPGEAINLRKLEVGENKEKKEDLYFEFNEEKFNEEKIKEPAKKQNKEKYNMYTRSIKFSGLSKKLVEKKETLENRDSSESLKKKSNSPSGSSNELSKKSNEERLKKTANAYGINIAEMSKQNIYSRNRRLNRGK